MRVLVCGSRTYNEAEGDTAFIPMIMLGFDCHWHTRPTLIHGAAPGADSLAAGWADSFGWHIEPYSADWDKHGKAAGPIRNQQMLDEGKPELVIAFIDKPLEESSGTNDMVTRAMKTNVPTYVIRRMS